MEERRTMRRFDLQLPCLICPSDTESQQGKWVTRNISSGGAYFDQGVPLPLGVRLEIQILFPQSSRSMDERPSTCVSLCGEVIRMDASGMAVEFDDQYQIQKIRQLFTGGVVTGNTSENKAMPGYHGFVEPIDCSL